VISYLASFLKKNQFLIFGVILKERLSSNDYIFFNSIIGIDHEGKIHSLYKKRRLVPFGEFIPFIDKIAYFNKNLYLKLRNFNLIKPGDDHESQDYFKFSDHSGKIFFPLICFEAIFPFSKNHKKIFQEVDMILNLSNDAWFDSEIAPRQFLRMTRVRSIESSKSSIRVTNRGFSCLIDQNGKIISKLEEKADNSSFIDVYIK
jgi:apolipoprotein N-acyltransferase